MEAGGVKWGYRFRVVAEWVWMGAGRTGAEDGGFGWELEGFEWELEASDGVLEWEPHDFEWELEASNGSGGLVWELMGAVRTGMVAGRLRMGAGGL